MKRFAKLSAALASGWDIVQRPGARWSRQLYHARWIKALHPPLMFGATALALTGVVGYRFYNQPQLAVGSQAPQTIYAPEDGEFLDEKTTEAKRKEIRTGIVPRLHRDPELTQSLKEQRREFLEQINQLRRLGAPFPYLPLETATLLQQQALRSLSPEEWQPLREALLSAPAQRPQFSSPESGAILDRFLAASPSPEQRADWVRHIDEARRRYERVMAELSQETLGRLSPKVITAALELNQPTWETTQQSITQVHDRILIQGLPAGVPNGLLLETIQLHLRNALPPKPDFVAAEVLAALLKDENNLTIDKEATKLQAEQAVLSMPPVVVSIRQGETIVKAGDLIDQRQFVILDGLGLSQRGVNWRGLARTAGLVAAALAVFSAVSRRIHRPLRRRDHILLCLLSVTAPALTLINPRYTDLPALGVLASSYYGPTLAISQVALLGGLSAFAVETINWEYLLSSVGAGLVAAALAGRLRSRDDLAFLGIGVGVVQGGIYWISYLILSATPATVWYTLLPGAVVYGLVGTAWVVVAIGLSPYLERIFDVVTPIRLVELSNPNCPLLQRLAKEAPGTFQHTLFVACLAESAARELRCNVELTRAGTLYHDIGKMHDPLAFIENQLGAPNKHDQINNPVQSAAIIKKHVSEGLVMARKYHLPQVIQDFIPEHQGTLLISYFYYQAKEKGAVQEEDFRYDGPIPQSRETGIVMLADSCEAALRSLKEQNPDVALAMVNRILKARWREHQLAASGLKYEELPVIAEVFVRVWQQFHHQRIPYPKAALELETAPKPVPQGVT
jgi:putative nucleotidyltransferase with HDIG domain